jgi:copper transport protein
MTSFPNTSGRIAPRRAWLAAALVCAALLARPAIAWAHAHLSKASPAPGAIVATSPSVLRLWFSEAPELSLTKVTLADSSGAAIPVGAAERDSAGTLVARIPILVPLRSGSYTVSWSTAAADGHPSKGHYSFTVALLEAGVGIAPRVVAPAPSRSAPDTARAATAASTGTEDAAASALTPAFIIVRAISFVAMLALIGAAAFRSFVLGRIAGLDSGTRARIERTMATRAALLAAVYLVAALFRLYLQNRMMSGDAALDAEHLRAMSMGTDWGVAWRLQVLGAAAALLSLVIALRHRFGWSALSLSAALLAIGTTMGAHAHVAPQQPGLVSAFDFLHILSASTWIGSLFWMTLAALPIIQSSPDTRAARAAALVQAFSPVALANATIVAITGFIGAKYKFSAWSPLWTTSYGQVLLVKLALLGGVAAVGFYNWRRVRPALGTDAATARLERSASLELGVGLLVIIVTAVLVATPTPT